MENLDILEPQIEKSDKTTKKALNDLVRDLLVYDNETDVFATNGLKDIAKSQAKKKTEKGSILADFESKNDFLEADDFDATEYTKATERSKQIQEKVTALETEAAMEQRISKLENMGKTINKKENLSAQDIKDLAKIDELLAKIETTKTTIASLKTLKNTLDAALAAYEAEHNTTEREDSPSDSQELINDGITRYTIKKKKSEHVYQVYDGQSPIGIVQMGQDLVLVDNGENVGTLQVIIGNNGPYGLEISYTPVANPTDLPTTYKVGVCGKRDRKTYEVTLPDNKTFSISKAYTSTNPFVAGDYKFWMENGELKVEAKEYYDTDPTMTPEDPVENGSFTQIGTIDKPTSIARGEPLTTDDISITGATITAITRDTTPGVEGYIVTTDKGEFSFYKDGTIFAEYIEAPTVDATKKIVFNPKQAGDTTKKFTLQMEYLEKGTLPDTTEVINTTSISGDKSNVFNTKYDIQITKKGSSITKRQYKGKGGTTRVDFPSGDIFDLGVGDGKVKATKNTNGTIVLTEYKETLPGTDPTMTEVNHEISPRDGKTRIDVATIKYNDLKLFDKETRTVDELNRIFSLGTEKVVNCIYSKDGYLIVYFKSSSADDQKAFIFSKNSDKVQAVYGKDATIATDPSQNPDLKINYGLNKTPLTCKIKEAKESAEKKGITVVNCEVGETVPPGATEITIADGGAKVVNNAIVENVSAQADSRPMLVEKAKKLLKTATDALAAQKAKFDTTSQTSIQNYINKLKIENLTTITTADGTGPTKDGNKYLILSRLAQFALDACKKVATLDTSPAGTKKISFSDPNRSDCKINTYNAATDKTNQWRKIHGELNITVPTIAMEETAKDVQNLGYDITPTMIG